MNSFFLRRWTYFEEPKSRLIGFLVSVVAILALDFCFYELFVWMNISELIVRSPGQVRVSNERYVFGELLLAPISEELIFRAPLRVKKEYLAVGVLSFVPFVCFQPEINTIFTKSGNMLLERGILCILICASVVYLLWKSNVFDLISKYIGEQYTLFFWILCIAFALIHLKNFEWVNSIQGYLAVALVAALHTILSLIFSFARLRFGLVSSVALHATQNSFPIIVSMIS